MLIGLRNSHEINDEFFRVLQNELDLEEAQFNATNVST